MINRSQEKIRKKIYKPVVLKKMKLSAKFPRNILCTRQSTLGVGLMSKKTIMNALALKLYIRHNRFESNVLKISKINEGNTDYIMDMQIEL